MTSSLLAPGAPAQRWPRSSPEARFRPSPGQGPASERSDPSTHTIDPPGLDVLDDVGVGDAVRAVAPPTRIMRLRKNETFVDIEFPDGRAEDCPAARGSTVSCRTRLYRRSRVR